MKVFWHSSDKVYDLSTLARLAFAFEDIVVPSGDDKPLYLPHSQLKLPSRPKELESYAPANVFETSSARLAWERPTFDHTTAFEKFGSKFADEYEHSRYVRNLQFDYFLETTSLNDGIVLGETELSFGNFTLLKNTPKVVSGSHSLSLARALVSMAGINIALPNLTVSDADEIILIKGKCVEEVADYQAYVAELLSGAWDIIKSDPDYEELVKWSNYIAETRIYPSLRKLESGIRSTDKTLRERLLDAAVTQLPDIVSGQLMGAQSDRVTLLLISVLKVIAPKLAESILRRRALADSFGLAYLYRLKERHKALPKR